MSGRRALTERGLPVTKQYEFNGGDYNHERDCARLSEQHTRIRNLMLDSNWRTLADISQITGDPPASVSAQLRHLRKPRFGSYVVEKEYLGDGLYQYRVLNHTERAA